MARRSHTSIGPMSKKSEHVPHWTPPRVDFDIPERVTNASKPSSDPYSQKADWANSALRPGCMDAFSLPSHGFRKTNSDRLIVAQESATAESASADVGVVHL